MPRLSLGSCVTNLGVCPQKKERKKEAKNLHPQLQPALTAYRYLRYTATSNPPSNLDVLVRTPRRRQMYVDVLPSMLKSFESRVFVSINHLGTKERNIASSLLLYHPPLLTPLRFHPLCIPFSWTLLNPIFLACQRGHLLGT